MIGIKKDINI